ncbi:MAG TPA: hypothetical protein DCZ92_13135 [Elusimicrobia bacterium]|nr:MAG: hypothetical protein A2016_08725 [Elusimicrobia bacterium GWF2_62_30]HBA61728.1 hypothetical protein [Elusimicrobiota bacterium]
MFKKTLWLIAACACGLALWRFGYPATLRYFFKVGGTITMGPELNASYLPANSMLLIVAKNDGGVPVAVKKIINPVFPLKFEITSANLIMPDLLTRKVLLEAFLNGHGRVGVFKKGDLKGECEGPVEVFRKDLAINLYAP